MTSLAVFQNSLHGISHRARGFLGMVEHLCCQYHGQQMRDDGSAYMDHVHDVMRQIVEIERACGKKRIDWATVCAGGCHDLIEDSYAAEVPVTPEIIQQAFSVVDPRFGRDVAFVVSAVSKRRREDFADKAERLAEYHERLFRLAHHDYRALLVKYPDRLHNLATLHGLTTTDPSKVERVAQETLDFYVPRGRNEALGILPKCYHEIFSNMVDRMERLALAYLVDKYQISYVNISRTLFS